MCSTASAFTTVPAARGSWAIPSDSALRSRLLGNGLEGIQVNNASNTTIGGSAAEQANLISRNGRNGVSRHRRDAQPDRGQPDLRQHGPRHRPRQRRRHGERCGRRRCRAEQPAELPGPRRCCGWRHRHAEQHAGSRFLIQFYGNAACDASQHGEGETFLGSALVPTDANGNATIPLFAGAGRTDGDRNRHERQWRRRHLRVLRVRDRAGWHRYRRTCRSR